MGHKWYGGFSYADDLKLLYPSDKGLQRMIIVCEEFSRECGVRFNIKKSMCMLYARNRNRQFEQMPSIKLEGALLAWVQSVKYLGTYIASNLLEDT